jgi:Na+:H+ antiporter, NhaA family
MSGIHATIAGVLAAMTIPAHTKIDEIKFVEQLQYYMNKFKSIPPNDISLLEPEQQDVINKINEITKEAGTPLQRLEQTLHPWVMFLVMPVFAFANSGIELTANVFNTTFFQGVSMGVFSGLVVGKFIGVFGMSWILKKLGVAELPDDIHWGHICGVSLLAGIGFTMSLFITTLAFEDAALVNEAKVGIFCASILSGVLGYFVLKRVLNLNINNKA